MGSKERHALVEQTNEAAKAREEAYNKMSKLEAQLLDQRIADEFEKFRGQPPEVPGERKVTAKTLKAQKGHLLASVDQAIKAAPEEFTEGNKITISVPGDGEWILDNHKGALKNFRAIAEKYFPDSVSSPEGVGIGGRPLPGLPSIKGKAMPKAVSVDPEDMPALIGDTVSTDQSRFAIQTGYADGQQIVATDGRQLLRIVTDKAPGSVDSPVRLNAKGDVVKSASNYPNYTILFDERPDLMKGGAKTDELWNITNQARALFKGTDRAPAMDLYVNPDGSMGGKADHPGVGTYEHNIKPGAAHLGTYNADYLFNAVDVARRLGNDKVDLYAHGLEEGPIELRGKNSQHLIMGMKMDKVTKETPFRDKTFPPSQKAHGSLPKGLPPLENPDVARTETVKEGGNYRVTLESGKFKVEQEYTTYGTNKDFREVASMALEDLKRPAIENAKELAKQVKEGIGEEPKKNLISKLNSAMQNLAKEREGVIAEGKKRTQAGLAEKVVSKLESAADAARKRLKEKEGGTTFGSGPLHELPNIRDYAIIGAAKIARFGLDKAKFTAEMIAEFGKRIEPHIDRLFEESKALFYRHAEIEKNKATPVQQIIGEATGAARAKVDTIHQIIDTLQSGLKTVRALKDHFTDAPQVSRAEVKLADDFLEADANRIKESLTELVKKELPPSERGIFITAINNATRRSPILTGDPEAMYRHAAEVAARIEERGVEVQKKQAVNAIKDNVAKAMASPTVDLRFKSKIGDMVKQFTFTKPTEATLAKLKSIRDYIRSQEELGHNVDMPKAILESIELLNKVPIKELPLHVLEAMRDRIAMLEKMGRRTVATRQLRWDNEKEEKKRELEGEATNPIEKRPEFTQGLVEGPTPTQKIRNFLNRRLDGAALIDKALLPIDALFDLLGDAKGVYKGWLFKHVRNPIDLGFNAAVVMRDRITKPLLDIIERHNLTDENGRRIGIYAALQQEGGRERLIAMGATPAELAKLESTFSVGERNAYNAMRKALDELLPPVQRLMHELYNIPVTPVENYFPMPREWRKVEVEPKTPAEPKFGEERSFDDLTGFKDLYGDYSPMTSKTEQGMTIERLKGAKTAIKIDAFNVFEQHVNDVAYLLSTQRDIKMIAELAKEDLFVSKYGKVGQSMVLNWLDTVARQGKLGGFRRWDALDALRKNTSAGVIGFRLASQFVHLSNIPLAAERTGVINYASGLRAAFTPEGRQFLKDNFAETFARGGGEPALVEAMAEGSTVFGKQIVPKKYVRAGFAIARFIDQKNSQATVLGMYLRALKEKGIDPATYTEIPIDKEAQARALVMARRAVASPLPKDVPMALSRGAITGQNISIGRAAFQFQNIFLDQWSNMRHDLFRAGIIESLAKTGNPIRASRMLFALGIMILAETGIREASKEVIKDITGYKPKKERSTGAKVGIEVARRFPGMGQITSQLLYGETGVPLLDSALQVPKEIARAVTAKSIKAGDKAKIRAIAGAAQLGGIPGASQIGEVLEKSQ